MDAESKKRQNAHNQRREKILAAKEKKRKMNGTLLS